MPTSDLTAGQIHRMKLALPIALAVLTNDRDQAISNEAMDAPSVLDGMLR